jgi:hypothetical protein
VRRGGDQKLSGSGRGAVMQEVGDEAKVEE